MTDELVEAFARTLRILRASRGLKQSELAERVGVDTSTISIWESAKRKEPPAASYVKKLEEALDAPSGLLMEQAGYLPDDKPDSIARIIRKHAGKIADDVVLDAVPPRRYLPLPKELTEADVESLLDMVELLRRRREREYDQ